MIENKPKLENLINEIENEVNELKYEKRKRKRIKYFNQFLKQIFTNSKTLNEFIQKAKTKLSIIKDWREQSECELAIKDFLFHNKREWFFNNKLDNILEITNSFTNKFKEINLVELFDNLPNPDNRFSYYINGIISSDDPQFNENERKLLRQLKSYLVPNPEIEKLLDKILIKLDEFGNENENKLNNIIKDLREDRIFLYKYWSMRENQIQGLNIEDTMTLYKLDLDLVKQNENMYPILFNYFDFIKNEILNLYESANIKTKDKEVFKYISGLTKKPIKWTAISKYYYDTFKDFDIIKLLT